MFPEFQPSEIRILKPIKTNFESTGNVFEVGFLVIKEKQRMLHSFDIDIAKKYGVHAAVILNNFYFWIEKNRANGTNFFDGHYWTYNSKTAFAELFPYMTARQIEYAIKKLIDDGLLITGNYNQMAWDRTLWYAITKKGFCILQNCEMEETKLSNGANKNVEPIPDINTDSKPQMENTDNKTHKVIKAFPCLESLENFNDELLDTLQDFVDMRKKQKSPMSEKAMKLLMSKLHELSGGNVQKMIELLNQSILNGWKSIYPVKTPYTSKEDIVANRIDVVDTW